VNEIRRSIAHIQDKIPSLGLRGCRISAFYPELTEMQVRAVTSATLDLRLEGLQMTPRFMVPMLCTSHELEGITNLIERVAFQVHAEYAQNFEQLQSLNAKFYEIGVIFNSPRSCLRAETIAPFVSAAAFNTKDITMLTFGTERGDAEKFFPQYIYDKIYLADPFRSLNDAAVGKLVSQGIDSCKSVKYEMEISVTDAEHTADARSIDFFDSYGVQSLSCAIEKIPIARIATAQTEIKSSNRSAMDWEDSYLPGMLW